METMSKNKTGKTTIAETSGFYQAGPQMYFVNSIEIDTVDKLLIIGKNYILLNFSYDGGLKAYYVKLTMVRFINNCVHVHLSDVQKYGNYLLHIPFELVRPLTTFLLMDVDSLVMELSLHFHYRRNEIIQKFASIDPNKGMDDINRIIWEEIVGLQGKV